MGVLHVLPVNDYIGHDSDTEDPDCICGPLVVPIVDADNRVSWIIEHHSLDGREKREGGTTAGR